MPTPSVKATLLNIAKHAKPHKLRLLAVSILTVADRKNIELPLGFGFKADTPERLYMSLASSPRSEWKTKLDAICELFLLLAEQNQDLQPIAEVIRNNRVSGNPASQTKKVSSLLGEVPLSGLVDRKKPTGSKLLG